MPNPFAHVELQSDDVEKSKKFYKSLFSWKLKDMPEMNYTMIDVGGGTGGGMMAKMMPEAPNAWLPYVQVDSVRKAVEKAKKLGGGAHLEYEAIGEMGASGLITDTSGAAPGRCGLARGAAGAARPAAK